VSGPQGPSGPSGPGGISSITVNGNNGVSGNFSGNTLSLTMSQNLTTGGSPTFVNVTATSDERLKTDIRNIENALDKVMQLRGVLFTRIDDGIADTGVIAQEILKVLPEAVKLTENGYLAVAYGNIVGLLIEAIKELKLQLDEIKKKLP
jgi:hypothetical protein